MNSTTNDYILKQYVYDDCLQVINMFNDTLQDDDAFNDIYNDMLDNLFFTTEPKNNTIRIEFFSHKFSMFYEHDLKFILNSNNKNRSHKIRLLTDLFQIYFSRNRLFKDFDTYCNALRVYGKKNMFYINTTWNYVYQIVINNIIKTLITEFRFNDKEINSLSEFIILKE